MASTVVDDQSLKNKLKHTRNIVVIGCSEKKYRTSYHIAEYLHKAGYRVVPVNPNIEQTLGKKAYTSMDQLPADLEVDIVDIFRNKRYTAGMVRQVADWSEKTGQKPLIWTQLDVSTPEAREIAETAGLPYIENKCLMVEHGRLLG